MSSITLKIDHDKTADEAKAQIQEQLDKMGDKLGLNTEWQDHTCKVSGPAKGTIIVTANYVKVEIKLGLSARLFKAKIEQKIEDGFQKVLR